jgi:DNA-binding XRE family transcriptional regulator
MRVPQVDWSRFAVAVIRYREEQELRKNKMVKLTGVSRWTLYRAECGERVCVQNYLSICALLEVSPYKFYHGRKPHFGGCDGQGKKKDTS